MLKSHLNSIEKILLAQSQTATNAGHPNLRGNSRELFIREFLEGHLPSLLEIGQGEIIDSNSVPNPPQDKYRPQVDIVLYRKDTPKISYSKDNIAYLAEGVLATVEIKTTLTKDELRKACDAAKKHNSLNKGKAYVTVRPADAVPDKIFSYVLAYNGPENMQTVSGWMKNCIQQEKWSPDEIVDMVIVLGKGTLWNIKSFPNIQVLNNPNNNWAYIDQADMNLLIFFAHMLTWVHTTSTPRDILGYLTNVKFPNVRYT